MRRPEKSTEGIVDLEVFPRTEEPFKRSEVGPGLGNR